MMKDPVCGMMVDEASAAGHVQYHGKEYYFCSKTCQRAFVASPHEYIKVIPAASPPSPLSDINALYTCPNHPMVLAPRPGTCPKCGSALELVEPRQPSQETGNQCK